MISWLARSVGRVVARGQPKGRKLPPRASPLRTTDTKSKRIHAHVPSYGARVKLTLQIGHEQDLCVMAQDCANPLLAKWLKEWMDQAKERNSKGYTV